VAAKIVSGIDCELALARRIEHSRFQEILSASPRSHYHCLRISLPAALDREARRGLREAYAGAQQRLRPD